MIFQFLEDRERCLRFCNLSECRGGRGACLLLVSALPEVSKHEHEDQLKDEEDRHPGYESRDVETDLDMTGVEHVTRLSDVSKGETVLLWIFLSEVIPWFLPLVRLDSILLPRPRSVIFLRTTRPVLVEFIHDLKGVSDEDVIAYGDFGQTPLAHHSTGCWTRPDIMRETLPQCWEWRPSLPPIWDDPGVVPPVEVLVDALYRLTAGHAGSDQSSELNNFTGRKLECIEVSE